MEIYQSNRRRYARWVVVRGMRDMIPPGERSIRNIPVSGAHRPRHGVPREEGFRQSHAPLQESEPRTPRRRWGAGFWLAAAGVAAACAAGAFLLSTVFAGASVTVYPRTETITPPRALTARLNPPAGELAYRLMTVQRAATTTAPATGTSQVSRQASGLITIYNAHSAESQLLIANTRFRAPDGKIYRIRESITVPGGKRQESSLAPGTTTVTVYADSPGEEYNREEATEFVIAAFAEQNDPRAATITARSQGPISGGFVGEEPAVPQEELARAEAALRLELETAVRTAAAAEIPEGYLPVPGTLSLVYGDIMRTSQGNTARLSQTVMATAAIVRQADLAAAVASRSLEGYGGEAVLFADPSALSIMPGEASGGAEEGALPLALAGSPTLVWQVDREAVTQALLGKERGAITTLMERFAPAIAGAEASIRPFWKRTFPEDPAKISVTAAPTAP